MICGSDVDVDVAIERMICRMMQLFNGLTGDLRDEVTVSDSARAMDGE